MSVDNAPLLVTLFIFGGGVLWRAGSLTADIVKDWGPRVEDARTGLNDRATQELLTLQSEIGSLLGVGSSQAVPLGSVADPGVLASRTHDFQAALGARSKLDRYYSALRRIGPALTVAATIFLIGWAGVAGNETDLISSELLCVVGISIMAGSVVVGLALTFIYGFLNQRLAGAELLASSSAEPARDFS